MKSLGKTRVAAIGNILFGGTGILTVGGLSPSSVFKTELWRFIGSHSIQN